MAEQYRFFGSAVGDTREYNQVEFAEVLASFIDDGHRHNVGNDLNVIASTPNAMTVEVQDGEAFIQGYWYQNTADKTLTIATANATNPRIDSVILKLDVLNTRAVVVTILQGTPAVTPVPPTLTQDSQTWEIRLADIYVGAGVVSINDSNITNYEPFSVVGSKIFQYDVDRQVVKYINTDGTSNDIGGELWWVDGIATENILNGAPVQKAGIANGTYTIKNAVPSEINADPSLFLGLATKNIAINTYGKITKFGIVHDMNTNSWATNTKLYFDSTNGGLTSTKPSYPNAVISVGFVNIQHATNGDVTVDIVISDKDKQPVLISGTNIKSINGSSILGSGDLPVITPKNWIINGGFDVWQRGTSFTTNGYVYTADRWLTDCSNIVGTHTYSQQTFTIGQNEVPNNPKYFFRFSGTTGSNENRRIVQKIESPQQFSGKTVSLSFWAKGTAGLNISVINIIRHSSGEIWSSQDISLSSNWTRYTITYTIANLTGYTFTNNNYVEIRFAFPNSTAITFDIANVSLVEGSVPVEWQTEAYADVLDKCQRYCRLLDARVLFGVASSALYLQFCLNLGTPMRSSPTFTMVGAITRMTAFAIEDHNATHTVLAQVITPNAINGYIESTAFTANRQYMANNTGAYVLLSSEL